MFKVIPPTSTVRDYVENIRRMRLLILALKDYSVAYIFWKKQKFAK